MTILAKGVKKKKKKITKKYLCVQQSVILCMGVCAVAAGCKASAYAAAQDTAGGQSCCLSPLVSWQTMRPS